MSLLSIPPLRRPVIAAIEKRPVLFLIGVVVYIVSPIDLLPASLFGPIGAFDDVLVALMGWAVLKGVWRRRRAAAAERRRIELLQTGGIEIETPATRRPKERNRPDHRRARGHPRRRNRPAAPR